MKKKTTMALILMLLIGLTLLLYPSISNYWNSLRQSKAIAGYIDTVAKISPEDYDAIWSSAQQYNRDIDRLTISRLDELERAKYFEQLNITENGIMGYIEIPGIGCSLPIYHGTSNSVLQVATGHVEGSSLPVGGEGSHCVISGHRGLPNAKLFTNLDQMREGDVFLLSVLDETLIYEVDCISVVEPADVSKLTFEPGQDLCTLVTCTPYGVNSHRLLVRGHRVTGESVTIRRVTADATQVGKLWVILAVCIPVFLIWSILLAIRKKRRS